ncbi:MAG TPA: DUF6438 domain-containing protein [Syntrophales bacterium]|nr:DUF6438 domain-containing protein [Syntrophales bacterium]
MFRWIAFFFAFAILAFPNPSAAYDPQSVVISLERGPCFGSCPVYRVTMYGDGTVRYDGMDHVRTRGSQTAVISPGRVKQLSEEIERSGFFNLRDFYTEVSVTDAPTVVLYVAADGKKKQLKHYLGDFKAPKTLETIEARIDEVAGTGRWTSLSTPPIATQAAPKAVVAASAKGLPGIDEKASAVEAAVSGPAIGTETEQKKISLHRAVASSLRDEAYTFQLRGQLRDAVIRYRQSLVWWPDAGLESYVEPLEKKAGFDAIQYRPEGPPVAAAQAGSTASVNKPGRVSATIRNRSTQDVTISVRGESDRAGTLVRAGDILIRPVQLSPNGEVTFMAMRNGQTLATRSWRGNPSSASVVPSVLYDDNLQDELVVMTGLK